MKHFAIHYTYPHEAQLIVDLRPRHREFLKALYEQGQLVGSGPYTDGGGSALIIIRLPESATVADAEKLMDDDPFHTEQVLDGRSIREWNPVMNIFRED